MENQYADSNPAKAAELVKLLITWFEEGKRDLIWRTTLDPYLIWISEIMAQQTRITAVLPYYDRFIRRFPTLSDLANAPIEDVLKMWEGLGYYTRAHNLAKTAKVIFFERAGIFPETTQDLIKLPGIGAYTAGAIASICFHQPTPAVDGNVLRVFSRLENNNMDIQNAATKKLLIAFLQSIIPVQKPGMFNQALMELGALICIPKNPACSRCPVSCLCEAFLQNRQQLLPIKSSKKALQEESHTVFIIRNENNEVLMRKRHEKLLKGLWIFYMVPQECQPGEAEDHLQQMGLHPLFTVPIGNATHTFTHLKWNMTGYECQIKSKEPLDGYSFVPVDKLTDLAMPSAIQYFRDWLLKEKHDILF